MQTDATSSRKLVLLAAVVAASIAVSADAVIATANSAEAGRVEFSEDGFAVTFPDHWDIATRRLGQRLAVPMSGTEPQMGAWLVGYMEDDAPSFPPIRAVAAAPAPEPWGWCHVYVIPNPEGEPLEAITAIANQPPAQNQVGDMDVTFETLAARTVAKLSHTIRFDDERGSHYMYSHSYTWAADVTFYQLSCSGQQPPHDEWLSIAQTFEFLGPSGQ